MIHVNERPDVDILIVTPSGGLARYVWFEMSMEALFVPQGSDYFRTMSGSPAKGRNEAIRNAPETVTHLFFIDDDHWFEQDVLMKLLARRVPIVAALTCLRYPPFTALVFSGETVHPNGHKTLTAYSWAELDERRGLIPVFAGPGAGLLVERRVFKALPDPWFVLGKYNPEEQSEDVYFYEQARNAGFPAYVDLDTKLGHISPVAVWPEQGEDGVWRFGLTWENRQAMRIGRSDRPEKK